MKELAEVVAVDGNRVTVTTQLKTACSGCAQVSTCGAGILSKVFADRNAQFHVVTDESVTVGDRGVRVIKQRKHIGSRFQSDLRHN